MSSEIRMSQRERDAWTAVRDNCLLARQFLGDRKAQDLASDVQALYAIVRSLEIVSEASRRLRGIQQDRFPSIPWRDIEDAGNVYRHGYDALLVGRIRETVLFATPPLLAAACAALGDPV